MSVPPLLPGASEAWLAIAPSCAAMAGAVAARWVCTSDEAASLLPLLLLSAAAAWSLPPLGLPPGLLSPPSRLLLPLAALPLPFARPLLPRGMPCRRRLWVFRLLLHERLSPTNHAMTWNLAHCKDWC